MSKFNVIKQAKLFNQISLRERLLMFCALIICTVSILYFWIFDPSQIKQVKADKALSSSYQLENKLNNEIAEITLRLKKDPLRDINQKIAFSAQRLAVLDNQLEVKLVKFIHAKKMSVALSKVLNRSPGVKIVSLTTLPVSVVLSQEDNLTNEQAQKSTFYKHTLEVKLIGSYNAIYQYILNLEAIPEKFHWSVLTYKVSEYPLSEVLIQIYTLSDQQDLVSG